MNSPPSVLGNFIIDKENPSLKRTDLIPQGENPSLKRTDLIPQGENPSLKRLDLTSQGGNSTDNKVSIKYNASFESDWLEADYCTIPNADSRFYVTEQSRAFIKIIFCGTHNLKFGEKLKDFDKFFDHMKTRKINGKEQHFTYRPLVRKFNNYFEDDEDDTKKVKFNKPEFVTIRIPLLETRTKFVADIKLIYNGKKIYPPTDRFDSERTGLTLDEIKKYIEPESQIKIKFHFEKIFYDIATNQYCVIFQVDEIEVLKNDARDKFRKKLMDISSNLKFEDNDDNKIDPEKSE
jgi:hypothetical protein